MKTAKSEVDFRVTASRCAAYLQDTGTRAIFSEDFSSILWVPTLASSTCVEQEKDEEEDETNMPPHMNPKIPSRGFKKCKMTRTLDQLENLEN